MRTKLLVFGCFADDSQGVLTAVQRLALMFGELHSKALLCFPDALYDSGNLKLKIAKSADPDNGDFADPFDNSKITLGHDHSFPQAGSGILAPVGFKRHHY